MAAFGAAALPAGGSGRARQEPQRLRALLRAHARRLALTYGLFSLEAGLLLLQPLALGRAVDGLLRGSLEGLLLLLGVQLAYLAIGGVRRALDTRTFTRIYGEVAAGLVLRQRDDAVAPSRIAARSALARELVDFLERDALATVNLVFAAVGALAMLALYDPLIGLLCLVVLGPISWLNRRYARRALALSRGLNDELERQVGVIGQGDPAAVRAHYGALARWRVRVSDTQALQFGIAEAVGLGLVLATLLRAGAAAEVSAGEVIAMVRYAQLFALSLTGLPVLVGQLSRLQDICRRVFASGDD